MQNSAVTGNENRCEHFLEFHLSLESQDRNAVAFIGVASVPQPQMPGISEPDQACTSVLAAGRLRKEGTTPDE